MTIAELFSYASPFVGVIALWLFHKTGSARHDEILDAIDEVHDVAEAAAALAEKVHDVLTSDAKTNPIASPAAVTPKAAT